MVSHNIFRTCSRSSVTLKYTTATGSNKVDLLALNMHRAGSLPAVGKIKPASPSCSATAWCKLKCDPDQTPPSGLAKKSSENVRQNALHINHAICAELQFHLSRVVNACRRTGDSCTCCHLSRTFPLRKERKKKSLCCEDAGYAVGKQWV